MHEMMGYVIGVGASPVHAVISIAILSAVGHLLYRWIGHEPKMSGPGHDVGGSSGAAP